MSRNVTQPEKANTISSFDAIKEAYKLSGKAEDIKQYTMISGDREGFEICEPALNDISKISFWVLNKIGEAQAVKLLTNLLCYTSIVVLGEVLIIAKIHDSPLDWMWELIKASQGNSFAAEQIYPFIFDGSSDYSCRLEIGVKDTDLTLKLADQLNVLLPLGRIIEARSRQAREK